MLSVIWSDMLSMCECHGLGELGYYEKCCLQVLLARSGGGGPFVLQMICFAMLGFFV